MCAKQNEKARKAGDLVSKPLTDMVQKKEVYVRDRISAARPARYWKPGGAGAQKERLTGNKKFAKIDQGEQVPALQTPG